MKITICNQKGGAGKTMITMLLAMALADAGRKVGVVDLDKQATASKWSATIGEENIVILEEGSEDECDFIIYDTPPKLGSELIEAVKASDVTVVVAGPAPTDAWSTQDTVAFLKKKAPKANVHLLFNKVEKGRKTCADLDGLASAIGLEPLATQVPNYAAYQHSGVFGWKAVKSKESKIIMDLALEIISKAN